MNKLNDVLNNPDLEKEFQEVFTFIENVTDQNCNMDHFSFEEIEIWNRRFDDVIKKLLF